MKDNQGVPFFGSPPKMYDQTYFARMLHSLEIYLQTMNSVGPIRISTANISNLPTSDTGLRTGDLWNDAGTVKVVT